MRLLRRIRQAAGAYVPWDELGAISGRARDDLQALTDFGFGIECHPVQGGAYRGPTDRLCPDQIEYELGTCRIGRRIAVWNRASSTNDLAARAARSVANDGLVVLAEEQTAGRGQRGRIWTAPPRSSILMSVVLFPPEHLLSNRADANSVDGRGWLTVLGAVAVAEVVAARTGQAARIKWPNDVRVEGRKIAGILVEWGRARAGGGIEPRLPPPLHPSGGGVIIGIGLNVNLAAEDFPADLREISTSLRILRGGEPLDRSELARDLIHRLDALYRQSREEGLDSLSPRWAQHCEHLGRKVQVTTPRGTMIGRLVDLDLRQGLTLDLDGFDPAPHASSSSLTIPLGEILSLSGNVEVATPGC